MHELQVLFCAVVVAQGEERLGFFICVGALKKKEYCESARDIVKVFFHNINHKLDGELFFRGYDEKGAVKEAPELMTETYQAGKEFIKRVSGS